MRILLSALLAGMFINPMASCKPSGGGESKPNVLVIVVDDLGYADLGFLPYASKDISTPNINRLMEQGVFFSNAYSTSPICSPSRAGLITGRYQQRWGNYWYGEGGLPAVEKTLPQMLKVLGYHNVKIGKTHLNGGPVEHPLDHGFDEFLGFIDHTWDYLRLSQDDVGEYGTENARKAHIGPLLEGREPRSYKNGFTTDIFTEKALEVLGNSSDVPWYIELEYNAVHHPTYVCHPEYLKKYGIKQFPFWDPKIEPYNEWHQKWGHLQAVDPDGRKRYRLQLEVMDNGIGKILDALKKEDDLDNTLIVFLSDNGGTINTYARNRPLNGYKYMFGEGGVRIPMIISWPGKVKESTTVPELASAMDVLPTVVSAAGGRIPENLDGHSLWPVIAGEIGGHEELFWSDGRGQWIARKGKWKLIHSQGWDHTTFRMENDKAVPVDENYHYPEGLLLFDLDIDLGETTNLAGRHPEVVEELTSAYELWRSDMSGARTRDGVLKKGRKRDFEGKKPNILFCIADDASLYSFGAYGDTYVNTPSIDRLAREGAIFHNAYNCNPKCAPARACLVTGKYSWQLKQACNHFPHFPPEFEFYPHLLMDQGYHVGYTGKGWGPGSYDTEHNPAGPAYNDLRLKPPYKGITDIDYAANFESFLKENESDKPFCFWLGTKEPHRFYELDSWKKAGSKLEDAEVQPFFPDNDIVRGDLLDYALEVEWYDKHVGRAVRMLEDRGLLDNTLIVVTSDHGMPFPRVKGQIYEEGFHVPFIVYWKGVVQPGRLIDDFVSFPDVAPTFMEVAGFEPHDQMTGKSFLDILKSQKSGQVDPARSYVLLGKERHDVGRANEDGTNLAYPVRAIRTNEFLYVHNIIPERWPVGNPEYNFRNCDGSPTKSYITGLKPGETGYRYHELAFGKRPEEELYDMQIDPHCMNNLADLSEYREIKTDLRLKMEADLNAQGDPRTLGNGDVFDKYKYVGRPLDYETGERLPMPNKNE